MPSKSYVHAIYSKCLLDIIMCVLCSSVQVSKSMQDEPLSAIDEKLLNTGRFLDEFVNNWRKLRCLKIFCECTDIVEWLVKETKGKITIITVAQCDTMIIIYLFLRCQ